MSDPLIESVSERSRADHGFPGRGSNCHPSALHTASVHQRIRFSGCVSARNTASGGAEISISQTTISLLAMAFAVVISGDRRGINAVSMAQYLFEPHFTLFAREKWGSKVSQLKTCGASRTGRPVPSRDRRRPTFRCGGSRRAESSPSAACGLRRAWRGSSHPGN